MPQPEEEIIRKRQRERSRQLAVLLGAFVVLMFAITIAKMSINQ
jgi:cytochrome c oxidase assembly protein Cox11